MVSTVQDSLEYVRTGLAVLGHDSSC